MNAWMTERGCEEIRDRTTRAMANAEFDKGYYMSMSGSEFKFSRDHSSHAGPANPSIYWLLRTHPLNVRLPWIMWTLGSPVVVPVTILD